MSERSQINRYENKYLITESVARAMADFISPICKLDAFADPKTKSYVIHSLYFDTLTNDLYHAHRKKPLVRFKPRARTYAGSPACPYVWLELKCKIADKCHKTRWRIDAKDWPGILDEAPHRLDPGLFEHDGFMHVVSRLGAVPMTHVRYRREPYFSEIDNYVRITFDRELTMQPATGPHLLANDDDAFQRQAVSLDDPISFGAEETPVLLEIKCEESMPHWVGDLIARFRLERGGISKYMLSLESMRTPIPRFAQAPWTRHPAPERIGMPAETSRPSRVLPVLSPAS